MKLPPLPNWLSNLKRILTAPASIGALEISATSLKYLVIRNNTITQASLRLPPGIVEKGKVQNSALLVQALKDLHSQIAPANKILPVVFVAPQGLVYTQAFNVPIIAQAQLVESIMLNMQMISPVAINESFFDYQEVQERRDAGQLELLGAFAGKANISPLTEALRSANFLPVVVGFPALALASLIRLRWGGLATTEDYLVVYVSSEGIIALFLKNGNLAFNRFTPWHEIIKDGSIDNLSFAAIKDFVAEDLQRVLNFYLSRTGKQLQNAVLISPVFNYELITLVQQRLGITMHNLTIAELPKLQPGWFPALGAALRGTLSRSKDVEISLTAENTQTEYFEERVLSFISLWRNIVAGALMIVLVAFIFTDRIFDAQQKRLEERLRVEFDAKALANFEQVREKIRSFNNLVNLVAKTRDKERQITPYIEGIQAAAGSDIMIQRLELYPNLDFGINGSATSDDSPGVFKDKLSKLPFVSSVTLALNQITKVGENTVTFTGLRGTIKSPTSTQSTTQPRPTP